MPPVAAIDCGTNSTRLLVADEDGRSLTRRMTITRLGAGVDRTRRLAGDAVGRTLAVLREYRGI
ncbi:MAG TPA: exopolyphosphatase, partial [Acidimicrobiales bacterium]|nr:exopolyphosphatase [Acidimicrobiales bacterium]